MKSITVIDRAVANKCSINLREYAHAVQNPWKNCIIANACKSYSFPLHVNILLRAMKLHERNVVCFPIEIRSKEINLCNFDVR